jgi:multiple sugar transport system substrate-binding protein
MSGRWTRRRFLSATVGGSSAFLSVVFLVACNGGTGSVPTPAQPSSSSTGGTPQKASTTSGPAPAATAATTGSSTKATITVWWGVGPQQKAVATDFEKANPGIHVELAELGQNVYGNPKYLAAVAAGTGPDVAYQNRHTFHEFSSQGLYKDLTDLYKAAGFKESDIGPEQWKELTWAGKLYGIPYNVDGRGFFWNTQHFEEAGLDPQKGPETWSDIINFATKLTKKNGDKIERYGFIPGFPPGLTDQLLIFGLENGAKTYDEEGKKVLLAEDPAWAEALGWVKDVYDKLDGGSKQATAYLSGFAGQTLDAFAQGKVSMASYGSWMISSYAAYPDLKFNFSFAMPVADKLAGKKINWSCDYSFVMDPHTKSEDQSWKFIVFATGKDGVTSVATTGLALTKEQWQREKLPGTPVFIPGAMGLIPVNDWLKTSSLMSSVPEPYRSMALQVFDGITWAVGCGNLGWLVAAELWTGFKNAWDMVVTGQRSPQDALAAVTPPIQKALDQAWDRINKKGGG